MYTREESIETSATPARVWALLADVARWKDWNAGIETITIRGPFETGTTVAMRPPGQPELVSTLVQVKPLKSFTDETFVDGTRVLVSHRLLPLTGGGTRIVYGTKISGPAADEIGPYVTADFPEVLAALKRLAEQG